MANTQLPRHCHDDSLPIYFFHNPKTAGASLNFLLESVFRPEEICRPHLWHDLLAVDRSSLGGFRLFRGHFYQGLSKFLRSPTRDFLFLRNPLERALSHYGHVIRDPGHYLHVKALQLGSLEAYLLDPETRQTVSNFQARSLVNEFNPVALAEQLSEQELSNLSLERIIETSPLSISNDDLLYRAERALDRFCCIGITERFDDSVKLLSKTFNWSIDTLGSFLNSNTQRLRIDQITDRERTLLSELNLIDLRLYEYACSLLESRLKASEDPVDATAYSFISYAQNYEDVMLWRALKHIQSGFYIDVGANDPTTDSVTRSFYDRAWCGINIEPLPSHHSDLVSARPRDINLQCAVGAESGYIELWECDVRGWATVCKEVVTQHESSGHNGLYHRVPVRTLTDICRVFAPADIHFLKVDVEGFEAKVLNGMDFSKYRPWILLVEATRPNTTIEAHEEWESSILNSAYSLAYCDGLNRFYVANEHSELLQSFRYPPNVFDGFVRVDQWEAQRRVQKFEERVRVIAQLHAETESLLRQSESKYLEQAMHAEAKAQQAEIQLQAVYSSNSWGVTAPLRWLITQLQNIKR